MLASQYRTEFWVFDAWTGRRNSAHSAEIFLIRGTDPSVSFIVSLRRVLSDWGRRKLVQSRKDIVAWVGSHVLPHEAAVRAWLRRWTSRDQDIDDVIQEAYCRLAAMDDVTHVSNGRAYLFQTARNIVLEQVRRSKIVRIDNVTDIGSLSILDDAPPMDRVVAGARELQRVEQLIEKLPPKCRQIFVLRRIHGVSQREIAQMLGITQAAVEKQATRGLRLIMKGMERDDNLETSVGETGEYSRERTRDR
jgi:RNA polymerase sigma-70 factor (ECF subfamily)